MVSLACHVAGFGHFPRLLERNAQEHGGQGGGAHEIEVVTRTMDIEGQQRRKRLVLFKSHKNETPCYGYAILLPWGEKKQTNKQN